MQRLSSKEIARRLNIATGCIRN
ncbi:hypothetical protein [Candidatus Arsenophonus triatominarum]|nr:hypothetical protein [Candidatus Arsenophonus triatominarum]